MGVGADIHIILKLITSRVLISDEITVSLHLPCQFRSHFRLKGLRRMCFLLSNAGVMRIFLCHVIARAVNKGHVIDIHVVQWHNYFSDSAILSLLLTCILSRE